MPDSSTGSHPFRSALKRERYLAYYDETASLWPVPSEARTVGTDYGPTFVRISGPEEAPPLVLMPGQWGASLMWLSVIEPLSRQFRTYAVDRIDDFGRSVRSRDVRRLHDYMRWMDGCLDSLGLASDVNLLGCSYGGWAAAEYALHAPERLASLMLVSPAGAVGRPSMGLALLGMPFFVAALGMPSKATVGVLYRWLMPDGVGQPWFTRAVEHGVIGSQCFAPIPMVQGAGRVLSDAEFAGLQMPVLYVVGEHERLCDARAAAARLHRVAPRIEVHVLQGAGHESLPVEPVLRFLREVQG